MTTNQGSTIPSPSRRGLSAPASPIRKLMPYANAARARGIHIHHLNIGQPDFATPAPILSSITSWHTPTLAYAPSPGMPETVAAWAEYYRQTCSAKLTPEQILVTVGGSEAIIFAMLATCDPGDEILTFDPSYTNYFGFAAVANVTMRAMLLDPLMSYALPSAEEIIAQITPRTRALLFCNPNNPTGTVYTRHDLEVLLEVAERTGIVLIVDEVYRELVFDGLQQCTILSIPGAMERSILVDSVSKRFNACGARVGSLVTANKGLMGAALRFAQARLSAPTVEQLALAPLLRDPLGYTGTLASTYQARRDAALAALADIPGITFSRPSGAFYIILRLPVQNGETFAQWMLEEFSVDGETTMVAPLEGFYITPGHGANEVRLAFVLDEVDLARAVRILGEGLASYVQVEQGLAVGARS